MNTTWIKHGLTRIGVWCALVGVTVLLTVLFNFLGNLTCAVLSGMILGAARRWRWNAIPISLVFPAVLLSLSHFARLELPPGRVQLIAAICAAAFWGVYGLTFGLSFLEQKPEAPPAHGDEPARSSRPKFGLASLCGIWKCEDPAVNGAAQSKTLRVEAGKFVLTVGAPGEPGRELARGAVSVDAARPERATVRFAPAPESPAP